MSYNMISCHIISYDMITYHMISLQTVLSMTRNPLSILHNTIPSLRLVLFYTPSDNDTKNFKEKYIKLAASLRASGIKTGAVNCDKEPDLCDQHNANHLTGEARTRARARASTSVTAVVLSSRLIVTDGLRCSSRFS